MAKAGTVGVGKLSSYLKGVAVALAGSVAMTYLPNTLGVKLARQYLQMKTPYFKSVSDDRETGDLLNEVIMEINISEGRPVKRDGIEFIQTNALSPIVLHKGSSSTGCIIAFPIGTRCNAEEVFHYHCAETVGEEMAKFCLLSREAKKFLFARQIFYVEDGYVTFRCLLGMSLVVLGYGLLYAVNKALSNLKDLKLQMLELEKKGKKKLEILEKHEEFRNRAFRQRRLAFLFIGISCFQVYQLINNFYNWNLEKKADLKVAKLGPEYRKGGLEYYEKLLHGGQFCYRRFNNRDHFEETGNMKQGKYQLLFKHLPTMTRYHFFAQLNPEETSEQEKS